MILVCYDGSSDAQSAIDGAARLMPGAEATVLSIWQPFLDVLSRSGAIGLGFGTSASVDGAEEVDATSREAALEIARDGAQRATAAGLVAQPQVTSQPAGIAFAILRVAEEIDAGVIVLGTRGRGGVKSYLLGSVSHEVTQHADRAVLVVPSAGLAQQRRGWMRSTDESVGVA
ncbi:MAG: universal stress protein [Conexibacter sp.]|nr:universal stress protein [Conexibacter sp.]